MIRHHTRVLLELNEHDALQLIRLIRREINQTDKAWHPYWRRMANKIEKSMEQASFRAFQRTRFFEESVVK